MMRLTDHSTIRIATTETIAHLTPEVGGPPCGPNLDRGVRPVIGRRDAVPII